VDLLFRPESLSKRNLKGRNRAPFFVLKKGRVCSALYAPCKRSNQLYWKADRKRLR